MCSPLIHLSAVLKHSVFAGSLENSPSSELNGCFCLLYEQKDFPYPGKERSLFREQDFVPGSLPGVMGFLNDLERPHRVGKPSRQWGLRRQSTSLQLQALASTFPCQTSSSCATGCSLRGHRILLCSLPTSSIHFHHLLQTSLTVTV